MFGLTRREQRWKAEREAATLMVDLVKIIVLARHDEALAVANAKIATLTDEVASLRPPPPQLEN